METETKLTVTEARLTTALQLSQGTNEDKETMNSIIAYSPTLKHGDSLTITMPKVSEYHRSGKTWYSPPFYYKEGYKMCLVVSDVKMDPADECDYVSISSSVSIKLLQGEYDDKLQWPIGHKGRCGIQPVIPPPPLSKHSIAHLVYIRMCGLKRFQTRSDLYQERMHSYVYSSVLVRNDCITLYVRYNLDCYLSIQVWCINLSALA